MSSRPPGSSPAPARPAVRLSPLPGVQARRGQVLLEAETLADFGRRLLRAVGVPEAHARLVADSLVAANLRGVDSHGMQMIGSYLKQLQAGGVVPAAEGAVVAESGACLTYDGQNGLGQVVADRCTEHALRLARTSGLALVVARNANHFGAAAYWAEKIVRGGGVGFVMCNACPIVPPWQGKTARFGTSPFCAALPSSGPLHWMLDMATTTVALGKLGDAAYRGEATIPDWWGFLTADGQPTTDTQAAQSGQPTPFGRYKGSGLAMLVEILTAGLSGGPMASEMPAFGKGADPLRISHSYLVIDPGRFFGPGEFAGRMERLAQMVKSSEAAPGYDEVLIAGEPEWRKARERERDGIPIPASLWEQLSATATALNVSVPGPRRGSGLTG